MEEILISLLPMIIIVGVWIFIMFFFRKNSKNSPYHKKQDEMISLLTEIKEELKQLNKKDDST
jgi:flagellar basal body-associated protein FliL